MKKNILRTLSFVCFVLFLSVNPFFGKQTEDKSNHVSKFTQNILDNSTFKEIKNYNDSCIENGLWTGSVILYGTLKEGILFHEAYGHTSIEKETEVKPNSIFDMASVTKPIATATSLAILMDENSIHPLTPFTNILTEYRGKLIDEITLMDLARHVSGFNNFKPYIQCDRVIENVLNFSPVRGVGQHEYACVNYILMGIIIEKVSNNSLDEFCQSRIFNPLHMSETGFFPMKSIDSSRVVKSIFTPQLGIVSDEPARMAGQPIGNAGMYSTAEDLSNFCLMMLQDGYYNNKRILPEKSFQLLTNNPEPLSRSSYTFGWRISGIAQNRSKASKNTIMHSGWTGQSIWIDLEKKEYIIILTNRTGDHSESSQARQKIAELLLSIFHFEDM